MQSKPTMKPTMIRMSEETREQGEKQAAKLGLNLSEYLRLIIELDAAANIIEFLKDKIGSENDGRRKDI